MREAFPTKVDFGQTARDYAKFRAGFPDALFDRMKRFKLGGRVLDLGTGTGTLARGLSTRGHPVIGIDVAKQLLTEARGLDEAADADTGYVQAKAESLPFVAESFDGVSAGQCWHWFDRGATTYEILRVLKPGGWLAICNFDWIPMPGNVVEATESLIERFNPEWHAGGGSGIYSSWLKDVALASFRDRETFSLDTDVNYSHEGWRGRIRASAGVSASLSAERVDELDLALATLLKADYPNDPLLVPHRLFALIYRSPS